MNIINEEYKKTFDKLLKSKKEERIISNSTINFRFKDVVELQSYVLKKWDEESAKEDANCDDIEMLRIFEQVINESIFQYVFKQNENMFEIRKEFTQLNRSKSEDYSTKKEIA